MPNLSASNVSQLAYKVEGASYPTNWGSDTLPSGNWTKLNMTGETLDFTIKTEKSKVIQNSRSVNDLIQVSASAQGGFGFEAAFKEYDPFILGVLQANDWTHYGTLGVSSALPSITTITSTAITFSATTAGAGDVSTLQRGQWFALKPPAGASAAVKLYWAGRCFRVADTGTLSNVTIPIDAATPINTTLGGATMAAGAIISSSLATNGNVMKSYAFEVQHPDVSQYRQYVGLIPSKMDVKLSVGAIVTGTFEFMGKKMLPLATATAAGTPVASQIYGSANAVRGIFDILEGGVSISASTYIKSADLMFNNTLRSQEAVGNYGAVGVAPGTLDIGGKLEVYFADATMYNKFINNVASSMSIPILDTDGNGYVYVFPRIKYSSGKVNATGLDQDNTLSMDFVALPDTNAASPTFGKSMVIYRVGAG